MIDRERAHGWPWPLRVAFRFLFDTVGDPTKRLPGTEGVVRQCYGRSGHGICLFAFRLTVAFTNGARFN